MCASLCHEPTRLQHSEQPFADLSARLGRERFRLEVRRKYTRHNVSCIGGRFDARDLCHNGCDLGIELIGRRASSEQRIRIPLSDYSSNKSQQLAILPLSQFTVITYDHASHDAQCPRSAVRGLRRVCCNVVELMSPGTPESALQSVRTRKAVRPCGWARGAGRRALASDKPSAPARAYLPGPPQVALPPGGRVAA